MDTTRDVALPQKQQQINTLHPLTEKYRPRGFGAVIGQDGPRALFKALAAAGPDTPVPHFLLIGPQGTGKTTLVRAFSLSRFGALPVSTGGFLSSSTQSLSASGEEVDGAHSAWNAPCVILNAAQSQAREGAARHIVGLLLSRQARLRVHESKTGILGGIDKIPLRRHRWRTKEDDPSTRMEEGEDMPAHAKDTPANNINDGANPSDSMTANNIIQVTPATAITGSGDSVSRKRARRWWTPSSLPSANRAPRKESRTLLPACAGTTEGVTATPLTQAMASTTTGTPTRRIVIVDETDRVSRGFQAALLRPLERAPETALIMLANSTNGARLALSSRVLAIRFAPLADSDVAARLTKIARDEHILIAQEGLSRIVASARGDLRAAITRLQLAGTFMRSSERTCMRATERTSTLATELTSMRATEKQTAAAVEESKAITAALGEPHATRQVVDSVLAALCSPSEDKKPLQPGSAAPQSGYSSTTPAPARKEKKVKDTPLRIIGLAQTAIDNAAATQYLFAELAEHVTQLSSSRGTGEKKSKRGGGEEEEEEVIEDMQQCAALEVLAHGAAAVASGGDLFLQTASALATLYFIKHSL